MPKLSAVYSYIAIALLLLAGGAFAGAKLFSESNGTAVQQAGTTLQRIRNTKELNVGYIVFPPTVTKDLNTGEISGHFVATIREIAKQAGWKLRFVEVDWAGFPAALSSRRIDVSIAPTFVTIPRALAVAFTRPLFYAGNSAVVRSGESRFGNDIYSFDQPGVNISVIQGEASQEFVKTNFTKANINVLPGPEQAMAFQDVVSGRADAALGDEFAVAQFTRQYPDRVRDYFTGHPYNLTPVSWAVDLSDKDLLSFFDAAIAVLDTSGQLQRFEEAAGASWLHKVQGFSRR